MIIRGYLNRYEGGDTITAEDVSATFIPLTGNKILTNELDHVEKLITYETINGIKVRNVYIDNHRTYNTPYVHIYSVLLPHNGVPTALVNVHGIELLTGRHVVTLADRVYSHVCTHAIETNGDADYIQLLALSSRNASSDTEDYLTTLDDRSYNEFMRKLFTYMDGSKDLQYLYNDYIQRVGFVTKSAFLNLPETIDDVMGMLDVIGESNELVDSLIKTTVGGIGVPKEYTKYDNKTRRLVENGYLTNEDMIHSFCINCRSIRADKYVPVLKFNRDLLDYCYKLIETNIVEDERIYILSLSKEPVMCRIIAQLLVQHGICSIEDKLPHIAFIRRTIAEEVFIDIQYTNDVMYHFFIDLTIIPLICHGLRYTINEELV